MSLVTGKRSRGKKWTKLLLTDWVVDRVHCVDQRQKQTWMPGGTSIVSTIRCGDDIPIVEENSESGRIIREDDERRGHTARQCQRQCLELIENHDALGLNEGHAVPPMN